MSLAEDIAGALAASVYSRVGKVVTYAAACADGVEFTELHQNAVAEALIASFDGLETDFANMLEVDADLRTNRLEVPE